MFPVVVIPEITKGTESSIIYLPENVSFQMDLLFFFFFTLRIFSLIFFSCLSFHSYEIRTSTVQWKREEFKKI